MDKDALICEKNGVVLYMNIPGIINMIWLHAQSVQGSLIVGLL
jgi:hypothetical protein